MGEISLTLTDLEDNEAMAVIGGICKFQMDAAQARDLANVEASGNAMFKLAEQNPDAVRETFLQYRDAFTIAHMPDDLLETLDLKLENGTLHRPDGDDGWTTVEVE